MASTHVYVAPTRGGKAAAASSASMRIAFIHPDLGIGELSRAHTRSASSRNSSDQAEPKD